MASRTPTKPRQSQSPQKTSSAAASGGRTAAILLAAALVIATVVAYAPVWRFEFISLDDPQYVSTNPHIAGGVSVESLTWAFTTGREANWHPLTWISHIVDVQLFGLQAGRHHAVNLLLHIGSTLLLFGVLRRMTGSIGRSAFVAAIFALHPLHVESVAWVAERKDVLSAFFFMLTLWAYARYVDAPRLSRYLIVAACLALGLMAKAMLVTMPMLLLLLDYWPLRRVRGMDGSRADRSWAQLAFEKLPLLAVVFASSVVTFLVQRAGGAVKSLDTFPLSLRVPNTIVSYVDYLSDTVWPAGLGVFYPFSGSIPASRVAISAAILILISAAAVRLMRRAPYVTVGWLWFLGMLVPVIGLVQIGHHARADRYMYLPMIGLSIAVAWGAVELVAARTAASRRIVGALGVAAAVACATVTHAQVQHWRDTFTLWSHTATATDDTNNYGVYLSLGDYLRQSNRPAEAVSRYETAIQRHPTSADAYLGLGRSLLAMGQLGPAATALSEAVRLGPSSAEARMALGIALVDLGRVPEAVAHFSEAVRLRPDVADGHWRLGLALASAGRLAEALPSFATASRLDPTGAPIRNDYGWALAQSGQTGLAREQLNEALRLKPDFVDAHHNLGRVLAAESDVAGALTHLTEAVRLEPAFADARISLALVLARAGRIDEAATHLKNVLQRDPRNAAAARALAAIGR